MIYEVKHCNTTLDWTRSEVEAKATFLDIAHGQLWKINPVTGVKIMVEEK